MNDIEKLKKLNKMIPEMKKHGFADTFDEAARKTEEIFATKFIQKQQDKTEQPVVEKKDESHFDELKQQFETRIANMESNVSSAISKLNEIVKAINDIEQKLVQPAEVKAREDIEVKPAEVQTNIVKADAGKPSEADPKNGDFTPDNIDIRKYFNFSSKK